MKELYSDMTEEAESNKKKRVLIISDSLGTPIHPRGIFNYTCGLVQALNSIGLETYLLIQPPMTNIFGTTLQSDINSKVNNGTVRVMVTETLKHFRDDSFHYPFDYEDPALNHCASIRPSMFDFKLALEDSQLIKKQVEIELPKKEVGKFQSSTKTDHLLNFSGFVFLPFVYSESLRRASKGLRPTVVDVSRFDYVIIDTPSYIYPSGIIREKIFYVIHDLIPIYENLNDWTAIFARKLKCTTSVGSNAIFNSRETESEFFSVYSHDIVNKCEIIYPPIRSEVIQNAKIKVHATSLSNDELNELRIDSKLWNNNLPFFLSVLSDEPRKNIAAIVSASKNFVGKANFIIAGQINGNAYMNHKQHDFSNLTFPGYISDDLKFVLLRKCLAFIFPSVNEGFGIPITEASAFGKPVICTDIPVFREVSFGKAYYFNPKQNESISSAVNKVLNNHENFNEELKAITIETFSQNKMADRLKSFIV